MSRRSTNGDLAVVSKEQGARIKRLAAERGVAPEELVNLALALGDRPATNGGGGVS